jgi:hypothetical protein
MYNEIFDTSFDPGFLILFLLIAAGVLVVYIFYILSLQKALACVSPENRKASPGLVWLLLIPFFSWIWNFFVVTWIADSFRDEYARLNLPGGDRPTFGIGIAKSVLTVCSLLPVIGTLASLAGFVCWIIHWVKVNECRKLIEANQHNGLLDAERGIFHEQGGING